MSIGSGIAGQFGIATETVVNTPVAVTTFTEGTTEGLDWRPNFAQGVGLRAGGLFPRSVRRQLVSADGGGTFTFDIPGKGLGRYAQAMFGSYATTATQIGATTAYQQIHNSGSADGKTFSFQKGAPSIDGTVNPLTYGGCKVVDWLLTAAPNALATLQLTIDAMSVQPTGAGALGLQTASYSASTPLFAFNQVTASTFSALTVVSGLWTPTAPAAIANVRNITVKGGQPKDTTRWIAGSTTKAEALVNNFQPLTGQIDIDFASMALFNQFQANTSTGLQVNLTGGVAGGANNYLFQLTMPAIFLESGSTPKLTGPGIITVSYPFTALDDGTNGALQCQIVSTDTVI